jgi:hypothetical protein
MNTDSIFGQKDYNVEKFNNELPDGLAHLAQNGNAPVQNRGPAAPQITPPIIRKQRRDLNPNMLLCEQEFIRILFPTFGKVVSNTEYLLNKNWNFWSSTFSFFKGEQVGYRESEKPKVMSIEKTELLPILENGMVTGFIEETIDECLAFGIKFLEDAEEKVGAEIEKIASRYTVASPVVVPPIVIVNDANMSLSSRVLKNIKKIVQFVVKVFSFLICLPLVIVRKIIGSSEFGPRREADESIYKCFHNPMKNGLDQLQKGVSDGLAGFEKTISDFVNSKVTERLHVRKTTNNISSCVLGILGKKVLPKIIDELSGLEKIIAEKLTKVITDRLQFLRDNIIGSKNQGGLKVIIKNVINNVFEILGKRLKEVNDLYYNIDATAPKDLIFSFNSVSSDDYDLESPATRQNRIIEQLNSMKTLHPAIISLTKEEQRIFAGKNQMGLTTSEEIAKLKTEHAYQIQILEDGKAQNYYNPAMFKIFADSITSAKAKFQNKMTELNSLMNIEDRMAKAEKAYLRSVCELLVDTILFPKGIPFYFNATILLPDAVQLGLNVMPYDAKLPKDLTRFAFKGKTIKQAVSHVLSAIYNRSITFKMQGVREYLLEAMSSSLAHGLNIAQQEGASLATKPIMDGTNTASMSILEVVKNLTSALKINKETTKSINATIENLIVATGMDPRVIGHTVNERIGMHLVNKHLLFSFVDSIKDQLLYEAKKSISAI